MCAGKWFDVALICLLLNFAKTKTISARQEASSWLHFKNGFSPLEERDLVMRAHTLLFLDVHQKVEVFPVHIWSMIDHFGMFVEMSTSGDICCPDRLKNGYLSESSKLYCVKNVIK